MVTAIMKPKKPQKNHSSRRGGVKKHPPNDTTNEIKEKWGDKLKVNNDGSVELQMDKEQMEGIMKNTPAGTFKIAPNDAIIIKKASQITEVDNLKFELGRLRTYLTVFTTEVEFEGNLYLVQVDPLNKMVKFLSEPEVTPA